METLVYNLQYILQDFSAGRLLESLIFLAVLLARFRPHLKKVEDGLQALKTAVEKGFSAGEARFNQLEKRIQDLENPPADPLHRPQPPPEVTQ